MPEGRAKAAAGVASVVVVVVLGMAGIALIAGAGLWTTLAVLGALISLALLIAFYRPWLTLGIGIDLVIVGLVWAQLPASVFD